MANLHNPVCAIPIAGPKAGICNPQGIVIKEDHLIVLLGGNNSGLKVIDIKQLLNKSRALLQLEADEADVQPDEGEASSRTSPSGKVKVYDVRLWSTEELTEVGCLVSLTTAPTSENEPLGVDTSVLALSFDKKTIFKISQFDFDIQQKRYKAQLEIYFVVNQGQPLCIYDAPEGLLISMHNQGIECLSREEASVELTSVVKKDPSVILGITKTAQKLVFSDSHDHSVNFCIDGKVIHSLGGSQPEMQDGFTVRFHSPSALVSYGESIFVCDTSNQAVRLISSLKSYKHLGEKLGLFVELFQLEEELSRKPSFQPSLEDGLIILKEAADFMKDVERQAYFRTGRRCPQGPDLALSKPTRDAFKMLHSSFEKTNSFFSENDLQHIAKDICFPSFTTPHVEHFFAGMRTPSCPTPDMHDYGSHRLSCIVKSVQKVYHSSFSVYTGPQSHYTERTINKREPEWLYDRAKLSKEHFRQEDSVKEKDVLREESRELRLFAREFGQGVRQQRVRDKTKEKAGTLPLSLSMIRRVQTNQTQNVVDMLEELQALDAGQPETAQIETRPVRFSKGDVVALKHNWKRYLEPFFLAILQEGLHCSNGGILERTMRINWLEPSEEDALLYTVGNEDNNNPPQCILDIVTVVQDGEKFILCRNEEQRLKNLANGSDEADYDSSSEDDSDGDKSEDDDDQPTRFEAGRSRSGRRVTRFVL